MKNPNKKEYQAPAVIDYGDVAELTQQAGSTNSDGQGTNTACPNEHPFCSHL